MSNKANRIVIGSNAYELEDTRTKNKVDLLTIKSKHLIGNYPLSNRASNVGADKLIVDGFLNMEYEEGMSYSVSIVRKNTNIFTIYKKPVDVVATSSNITLVFSFQVSHKIDGSPYYLAKDSFKSGSWLIVDWDSVDTYDSLYDYDGLSLSPTLFKSCSNTGVLFESIESINKDLTDLTILNKNKNIGVEFSVNLSNSTIVDQFQQTNKLGKLIYQHSTFSGCGMYVGKLNSFRYMLTYIKAADWVENPKPITKILVQIRQDNAYGTVLSKSYLNVNILPGQVSPIVVDLGEIKNFSKNLYVIFRADTYSSLVRPYDGENYYPFLPADGVSYPKFQYWTDGNLVESNTGHESYYFSNSNFYFQTFTKLDHSTYLSPNSILDNSIDNSKFKNRTIAPEKTKFFIPKKNLFNKNDSDVMFGGYDIGTDFIESPSMNLSGYIPVREGVTYVVSGKKPTSDSSKPYARFVTYYDNNLNFKSYISSSDNTELLESKTFTVPTGVSFCRLTIPSFCWENFQVEEGIVPTEVEEFKLVLDSTHLPQDSLNITTIKKILGDNLADPSKFTKGDYYINCFTGEIDTASGGFWGGYTDYIPITATGLYSSGTYFGGEAIGYAVYNKNKEYIRGSKNTYRVVYQPGDAYVRFTIKKDSNVMVYEGLVDNKPYTPFEGYIDTIPVVKEDEITISLPNNIYAVVGDTLQLFYRGMIQAVNPYNYYILVSCTKGKQYPRYFEYTPTESDLGAVDFIIQVMNNSGKLLAASSCRLVTVSPKEPSTELNIMCFGDSLTGGGTWCRESDRRLTETSGIPVGNGFGNINFVGSKKNSTTGFFGVGGWSWKSYTTSGSPAYRFQVSNVSSLTIGSKYTNSGNTFTIMEINVTEGIGNILCSVESLSPAPENTGTLTKTSGNGDNTIYFTSYSQDSQNPLWDYTNNKMTFIPYANKVSNGKIDVVYTLLSWNGQSSWRTDFTSVIDQVKIFADTLHSEFPNAKLKIMGIQVPSINGGMGANYGATGTGYSDSYGMVVTALNMNTAYQNFANLPAYSEFVEFVNVSSQFDSEYNMPFAEITVNTRSTITERRGTNGVHPTTEGYYQIADVVYRNFVANFCQ